MSERGEVLRVVQNATRAECKLAGQESPSEWLSLRAVAVGYKPL